MWQRTSLEKAAWKEESTKGSGSEASATWNWARVERFCAEARRVALWTPGTLRSRPRMRQPVVAAICNA